MIGCQTIEVVVCFGDLNGHVGRLMMVLLR